MFRSCPTCGKMFSHPVNKLCATCNREDQELFELVRDYLRENPNATAVEVVDATEVPLKKVEEFIKSGRLTVVPGGLTLYCQICEAKIKRGRLCEACGGQLSPEKKVPVEPVVEKKPEKSGAKMHILDRSSVLDDSRRRR